MTEESVVVLTSITTDELNVTHHENLVADPRMGAVVSFGGVVRNHESRAGVTRLEYEGHPRAAKTLREIADDRIPAALSHTRSLAVVANEGGDVVTATYERVEHSGANVSGCAG